MIKSELSLCKNSWMLLVVYAVDLKILTFKYHVWRKKIQTSVCVCVCVNYEYLQLESTNTWTWYFNTVPHFCFPKNMRLKQNEQGNLKQVFNKNTRPLFLLSNMFLIKTFSPTGVNILIPLVWQSFLWGCQTNNLPLNVFIVITV